MFKGQLSITLEELTILFLSEGYTFNLKECPGCYDKFECTCPKGHVFITSRTNWNKTRRCPVCARVTTSEKQKMDFNVVKNSFTSNGYILLTDHYINGKQKLHYICPNNHHHSITWNDWNSGRRCFFCFGSSRHSMSFIRSEFAKEGYSVLKSNYTNCHSYINFKCTMGHEGKMSWNNWRHGKRCKKCSIISNSGCNHFNWKGGITNDPYCDAWADKEYKHDIKKRDNFICLNPACRSKSRLTIHHIDYDKKNCHPRNLITICNSCNATANYSRGWHKAWYQAIIKNRYKYNYKEN